MKAREHHSLDFYKNLAHLFYAMAVVDNHVRIDEKRRIKELVENDWSHISDSLNSQEFIFSTLKELFDEEYDKEEAFLNFKNYFLQHPEEFSQTLKKKIMRAVNQIADAFGGRNKSESVLVSRLYFLMWDKK